MFVITADETSYRLQTPLFPAAVQLLHPFNNTSVFLSDEEESWNPDQIYNFIIVDWFSMILSGSSR